MGTRQTPYLPTLRPARRQAADPLPTYPKRPAPTLPYPPAVPNPVRDCALPKQYPNYRGRCDRPYGGVPHVSY